MDQDGLFFMLKMCNGCSHNKGSWKKCMSRKHNPRMSTVRRDELTFGHRQCVKPDQSMTIYKLRDNETNEEFLEFDENIVFQTACDSCLNIKSCLRAGHELVDWRPTFAGGRLAGTPVEPLPPPVEKVKKKASPSSRQRPTAAPASVGRGKGRSRGAAASAAAAAAADAELEDEEGGDDEEGPPAGGKGRAAAAAAAADVAPPKEKSTAKSSHKRKSPGPGGNAGTPAAKSTKVSTPRSAGSSQTKTAKSSSLKTKAKGRRGGRASSAPGGNSGSIDLLEAPPKMEIDTAQGVDGLERPRKRRGKNTAPAAVTPSPKTGAQEAFGKSSSEDGDPTAESNGTVPRTVPSPPKTVAEKLEAAKLEEAELLTEFEETHKRYAQDEEAKVKEMEAFQRAGEEALHVMREAKEEALRRISEARMQKGAERRLLIQERLKEFEAAEEASRVEARERDAKLEAEKERLSRVCKTAPLAARLTGMDTATGQCEEIDAYVEPPWIVADCKSESVTGGSAPKKKPTAAATAAAAAATAKGAAIKPPSKDDSIASAVSKLTAAAAAAYLRTNGLKGIVVSEAAKYSELGLGLGKPPKSSANGNASSSRRSAAAAAAAAMERKGKEPTVVGCGTPPPSCSKEAFSARTGAGSEVVPVAVLPEDPTGVELTVLGLSATAGGRSSDADVPAVPESAPSCQASGAAPAVLGSDERETTSTGGGKAKGVGPAAGVPASPSSVAAR